MIITMKTRICQFILLSLLLGGLFLGCKKESGADDEVEVATIQAKAEGIPFLEKLGIDVKDVVADSVINLWESSSTAQHSIALKEEVALRLLKNVLDTDEPMIASIVAVKPLPHDQVIVVYSLDFGDYQLIEFINYDQDGHQLDVLSTGSWASVEPYAVVEQEFENDGLCDSTICHFGGVSQFTLNRVVSRERFNSQSKTSAQLWRMERDYVYDIMPNGQFKVKEMKVAHIDGTMGDSDPSLKSLAMNDVLRYSSADPGMMPALDKLAMNLKPGTNDYEELTYVLSRVFSNNPQRVLLWLSRNPGNHLMGELKTMFTGGYVVPEDLQRAVDSMKDPAARQHMQEVISTWKPQKGLA